MELKEISADERFLLENVPCERLEPGEIISDAGRLEQHGLNEFMFRNRSENFVFRISDADTARKVRDLMARNFIGLASVVSDSNHSEQKIFCLRIIFFMCDVRLGHFQVILGVGAKEALAKKNFDVQDYGKLAQDFKFSDGVSEESCFAFVSALPPAETADEENSGEEIPAEETAGTAKVFQIQGRGCTLLVRIEGEGIDSRGVAYRAIFKKQTNLNERLGLQLAHGEIIFSDEQSLISTKVSEILHETPSYITTWNAYANREGDFLLNRARAVGTISYRSNFNHTESGLEITVVNDGACDLSYVSVGDVLEFRAEPPPYIADENMSWAEYQKWKNQLLASGAEKLLPRPVFFEVAKKGAGTLTLKTEKDLAGGGNLYFSIYGDEKQIRRRTIARERIENGTSASPNLGLILGSRLEDSTRRLGFTAPKRTFINPRSALLNEKIFRRNAPTVNQVAAIEIALNTPDIAVIQGPPGTGKTTVITGILERLNEISNKKDIQPGQVLVTSFQHDAVQNVIERISINSLPTIKFGGRKSDDDLTLEDSTAQWLKDMLEKLEAQHPQLKQSERERQLFNAYSSYANSPTRTRAVNFLQFARELVNDAELIKTIDGIIRELEPPKISREESLLTKIYRIPTAPESFADGGQEIFLDLLNELERLYGQKPTPTQAKVLEALQNAAMTESPAPEFFAEMLALKNQLIEKCKPEPVFEQEEIRADILEVYSEIKLLLRRPEDAIGNVVYELYREIRDNPAGDSAVNRGV